MLCAVFVKTTVVWNLGELSVIANIGFTVTVLMNGFVGMSIVPCVDSTFGTMKMRQRPKKNNRRDRIGFLGHTKYTQWVFQRTYDRFVH